jgi:hypothetical protein
MGPVQQPIQQCGLALQQRIAYRRKSGEAANDPRRVIIRAMPEGPANRALASLTNSESHAAVFPRRPQGEAGATRQLHARTGCASASSTTGPCGQLDRARGDRVSVSAVMRSERSAPVNGSCTTRSGLSPVRVSRMLTADCSSSNPACCRTAARRKDLRALIESSPSSPVS